MAGNSEWNKAVKQAFKMGRKTSKSFSLKDAMFSAKKFYKKGKNNVMSMGKQTRRRSYAKKRYNKRRMSRGGAADPNGGSMMQSLSKMSGLDNVSAPAVASKTEAPVVSTK